MGWLYGHSPALTGAAPAAAPADVRAITMELDLEPRLSFETFIDIVIDKTFSEKSLIYLTCIGLADICFTPATAGRQKQVSSMVPMPFPEENSWETPRTWATRCYHGRCHVECYQIVIFISVDGAYIFIQWWMIKACRHPHSRVWLVLQLDFCAKMDFIS